MPSTNLSLTDSEPALRVLFLPLYPELGASSRYRVYQYLPYLRALGMSVDVQSFMDERLFRLSYTRGRLPSKAWGWLKATVRRFNYLRSWREYDIIYIQRDLLPLLPPWVERNLSQRGAILVLDIDDALYIGKASRHTPLTQYLKPKDKLVSVLSLVNCVVAGNPFLRDKASDYCPDARFLPVAESVSRFENQIKESAEKPGLVLGWLGSPSTEKYLQLIREPLEALLAEQPDLQLWVVGGGQFLHDHPQVHHYQWSLEGEAALVVQFDVGLMPLPSEEWSQGKSGGKARTYMAAGIPPVATAIGYNLELIAHGRTGLLVNDATQWRDAIAQLLGDARGRLEMGERAKQYVAKHFDPERTAHRLADIIYAVHGKHTID